MEPRRDELKRILSRRRRRGRLLLVCLATALASIDAPNGLTWMPSA
jgi:hypothetical protein